MIAIGERIFTITNGNKGGLGPFLNDVMPSPPIYFLYYAILLIEPCCCWVICCCFKISYFKYRINVPSSLRDSKRVPLIIMKTKTKLCKIAFCVCFPTLKN